MLETALPPYAFVLVKVWTYIVCPVNAGGKGILNLKCCLGCFDPQDAKFSTLWMQCQYWKKYCLEHFNRCSNHWPYMHLLAVAGFYFVAHSQHRISAITSSTRLSFLNLDQRAVVSPSVAVCTLFSAPNSLQKLVSGYTWGYNPQLFCGKWCCW